MHSPLHFADELHSDEISINHRVLSPAMSFCEPIIKRGLYDFSWEIDIDIIKYTLSSDLQQSDSSDTSKLAETSKTKIKFQLPNEEIVEWDLDLLKHLNSWSRWCRTVKAGSNAKVWVDVSREQLEMFLDILSHYPELVLPHDELSRQDLFARHVPIRFNNVSDLRQHFNVTLAHKFVEFWDIVAQPPTYALFKMFYADVRYKVLFGGVYADRNHPTIEIERKKMLSHLFKKPDFVMCGNAPNWIESICTNKEFLK